MLIMVETLVTAGVLSGINEKEGRSSRTYTFTIS